MIELYFVRHGIAVERSPGAPDAFRPLTEKGRRRFRKTARALAQLGRTVDLVLTSPLVRAVQTAEILAGAVKPREVAVLEELDPQNDVDALLAAVAKRAGKSRSVALVGHDPQLSSALAALSGVAQGELDLKKGAIARIDVESLRGSGLAEPRWWVKPRSGTRVKGLPLVEKEELAEEAGPAPRTARKAKASRRKRKAKQPRAGRSRSRAAQPAAVVEQPAPPAAAESAESVTAAELQESGAAGRLQESVAAGELQEPGAASELKH